MLSRIVARDALVSALPLEPVENLLLHDEQLPEVEETAEEPSQPEEPPIPAPSAAEIEALKMRIAQLEQTVIDTEADAYARGRREAEEEAHDRYNASMQATAERLTQATLELAALRPGLCKQAEGDVLKLCVAIARRVLYREINIDPAVLQALVQISLDRIGKQEDVRVRVSPAISEAVRMMLGNQTGRPIEVTADKTLEPGSIIFDTTRGQLDASINSQLDEIERGLIDRLESR